MSREKQIKEMAHIISETQAKDMCHQIEHCGKGCPHYELYYEVCKDGFCAEALYNAGYRKQSDVVRCKDCAYRDTEGCPLTYWNGGELVSNVEDDDFCSGAKMKGGAE